MTRLDDTLNAIVHSDSPAQFVLFGLFGFVLSGLFPIEGWLTISATCWKFLSIGCLVVTIWGSHKTRRLVMLATTGSIVITAAFYFTTFSDYQDANDLRSAMQSRIMIMFLMIAWGLFLANLITRQMLEFERVVKR